MNIERLDTFEKVSDCIIKLSLPEIFFASPIILHTFLNKPGFALYSVSDEKTTNIFLQKEGTKELRLLFREFSDEVIDFLKKELDPPYIAYNELTIDPEKENQARSEEVFIDIEKFLEFTDGSVRRKYNAAQKHNDMISTKNFDDFDKMKLDKFWEEWASQKTERSEKFRSHTDHDKRFFDLFSAEKDFEGISFYDGDKMVGYTILVPVTNEICLGAFNKCLRGYTQLGLEIFIERIKMANSLGYKKISIAAINNDFKKQFKEGTRNISTYCYELWRKESFKTLSPNGYAEILLR